VIVVDQAEELFTMGADEQERRRFVTALEALGRPGADGPAALVVFGVRADFYPQCARYALLHEALEQRQVLVEAMSREEVRQAVLFPARSVRLDLEPGLVELLLSDLGGPGAVGAAGGPDGSEDAEDAEQPGRPTAYGYEPGRLPLLAHALEAVWQARAGSTMTVAGYLAAGGIRGAVAHTAEDVYRALDAAERRAACWLFPRLLRIAAGAADTRRAVPRARLLAEAPDPEVAATVLARFTDRRLLVQRREVVEITHEALLDAWPRLRGWLDEHRADHLARQQIEEAAAAWERAAHDNGLLYRGTRLEAARELETRLGPGQLGPGERRFLAESHRQRRRGAALRRGAVSLLAVLALIAGASAVIARQQSDQASAQRWAAEQQRQTADQQRQVAEQQRRLAVGRALQSEAETARADDPMTSLRLSLAALTVDPTPQTQAGLVTTLQQSRFAGVTTVGGKLPDGAVLSPDGTLLAMGTDDVRAGTLSLWDTSAAGAGAARELATLPAAGSLSYRSDGLSFSPDGRLLVAVEDDAQDPPNSAVVAWDLSERASPRLLFTLTGLTDVRGAAVSPDGRTLAAVAGGARGTLALWDVGSPSTPRQLSAPIGAFDSDVVLFGPDGRTLVTASGVTTATDDTLATITHATGWTLWDVGDPGHPKTVSSERGFGTALAFSPHAPILATGSDSTLTLWDLSRPGTPTALAALDEQDQVEAARFSPDGRSLVTATFETAKPALLWDVSDPRHPGPPVQLGADATSNGAVAFSPDGRQAVLAGSTGTVTRWSLNAGAGPGPSAALVPAPVAPRAAVFSPDGRRLVIGGWGQVSCWDVSDPAHPRRLALLPGFAAPASADAVAFNHDGSLLAVGTGTGDEDAQGQITIWNISDAGNPRLLSTLTPPTGVGAVAFDPVGTTLVASGGELMTDNGWAALWNTADPAAPAELRMINGFELSRSPAVFAPDGSTLVLPDSLWNASTPASPVRLPLPHSGRLGAVDGFTEAAFSSDGTRLATEQLGNVDLWAAVRSAPPRYLGTFPAAGGSDAGLFPFDLHPAGRLVAVGHQDGSVTLADVADPTDPAPVATLPAATAEIADVQFSPDGTSLLTTALNDTATLWSLGDLPAIVTDPVGRACRLIGSGLTPDQWAQDVPGLTYHQTCPAPTG
ncbi:WD40 repeat domain-containing protein, partial [Kitasatospora viridis]